MKPQLLALTQGQAEYRLSENHPLRIAGAAGRQIECLAGTAWITAYGEHTDFMLRQGQRFEMPNDGLTLIDAVGRGTVRVRLPADTEVPSGWIAFQRKFASALHDVGFHLRN